MNEIIVQKFGGTSLKNEESILLACEKVQETLNAGKFPVVVVSAMGRKGAAYATDTLVGMIAERGNAYWLHDRDLIMACGEMISAAVFADALRKRGHEAAAMLGGQAGLVTDSRHGSGNCIRIMPSRIRKMIRDGVIPVVAGFQGMSPDGEIVTLGRGGSDTTAALLGGALKAERVEIFTDVDGIMTADPRVVNGVRILREVSYDEVFQMADQGANVIHPRAVEAAQKAKVTMVVRNTFSEDPGTVIGDAAEAGKREDSEGLISAVVRIRGRTQIVLKNASMKQQYDFLSRLAKKTISVDLINASEGRCAVTIDKDRKDEALAEADQLSLETEVIENCDKVSIIGGKMRGKPGVMSRMLEALLKENIKLLQSADSHATISCLVPAEQSRRAMQALHEVFGLDGAGNV